MQSHCTVFAFGICKFAVFGFFSQKTYSLCLGSALVNVTSKLLSLCLSIDISDSLQLTLDVLLFSSRNRMSICVCALALLISKSLTYFPSISLNALSAVLSLSSAFCSSAMSSVFSAKIRSKCSFSFCKCVSSQRTSPKITVFVPNGAAFSISQFAVFS